ncbi:MAG: ABC transporter ATP-binding protein [Spirochaetaceae bacterium]|nr:ABC transporter ATP-binding protein [Spirochaetaceae bacterium]
MNAVKTGQKTELVRAESVKKDYKIGQLTVNALQGITLGIEAGEFTAIVGPSGSGKSTFLHLAGCLDTVTSGQLVINGVDTGLMDENSLALLRRRQIGFVFQAYNLIPVLSALENVCFPLTLLGVNKKDARERSLSALAEVGLADYGNRRPKEMSGGQQQRVAIARALVKKPSLILADEPTANLDSKTGQAILEIMLSLNKTAGTTFVFSTHDSMVMEYARRLVFLRDGIIDNERIK